MKQEKYKNGFQLTLHPDSLAEPLAWKKPHTIFVCSMSDLFHENVPDSFIDQVMAVIIKTPQHNYQILTKRVDRMARYFGVRPVPKNAWVGVSVDVRSAKSRIDHLRSVEASIRFLSCEPPVGGFGRT